MTPRRTEELISTCLQTFNIIHGFDDVSSDTWFDLVGAGVYRITHLTADPLNLIPFLLRLELRSNFLVKEKLIYGTVCQEILKTLEILSRLKTITNEMLETFE